MRPGIAAILRTSLSRQNVNYQQRQRLFQEFSRLPEMQRPGPESNQSPPTHSSIQKRQFWWWFSSSDEKEPSKPDSPDVAMPPRRNQNENKIQSSQKPKKTKVEKQDDEVKRILDIPIGALDDESWPRASTLLEQKVAQDNIIAAFWLLDRLSHEPDANIRLTQDMVYSVVKRWSSSYASQQKKGAYQKNNKIHHPLTVWRKVDAYISRGVSLTPRTLHRVMDSTAYANAKNLNSKNGPLLAETIVQRIKDLSTDRNSRIQPTRYTFTAAVTAWETAAMNVSTRSAEYDKAAKRALGLLNQLKSIYESVGDRELRPNSDIYMKVMRFFAHKGDGEKVEELMEDLYGMYLAHDKDPSLLPTTDLFSLVLFAWSRSNDPGAAQRATQILDQLIDLEAREVLPGLEVTARIYNTALICWSRVGTKEALNQMQALSDRMLELSKSDPRKKPTGSTYGALVTGWSQVDPARAEQIVWTWKKEAIRGNCTIRIDTKLIDALVGGWYNSKVPDTASMCDRIVQNALEEGSKVNLSTFNMVINAWCREKSIASVDRAETLLRQMQELVDKKNNPDLKPTIFTYAPIIFGYANPGRPARAEALLREFFERYPANGRGYTHSSRKSRLDTRVFNGVLKSWKAKAAKDVEAVERSENLLLDMPRFEVHPDITSFDLVLQCKERQKKSSLGKQATLSRSHEIILLLDTVYKEGNLGCTLEQYLTQRQAFVLFNP